MPTTQYKTDIFYPHKNWYKHQNVLKVIKCQDAIHFTVNCFNHSVHT